MNVQKVRKRTNFMYKNAVEEYDWIWIDGFHKLNINLVPVAKTIVPFQMHMDFYLYRVLKRICIENLFVVKVVSPIRSKLAYFILQPKIQNKRYGLVSIRLKRFKWNISFHVYYHIVLRSCYRVWMIYTSVLCEIRLFLIPKVFHGFLVKFVPNPFIVYCIFIIVSQ